jgi:hypothetical protein
MLTFFGLTPDYKITIYNEVHDLTYHGGGGFTYSEVYNMPIYLRRYSIQRINKLLQEEKASYEKALDDNNSRKKY